MQTKRDHVQAHRFAVSGSRRPSSPAAPAAPGSFPAGRLAVFAGVLAAALLCGGAAIYGLLHPVTDTGSWRQQAAVVVDQQTGTRFIYLNGALHPTANYASALLAAGTGASPQIVPDSDLAGVPVGATIGIPGAPQTLPSRLLSGPWAICLNRSAPGGLTLDLDPAAQRTGSANGRLILLSDGAGRRYLLWDGRKYLVTQPSAVVALGLSGQQPVAAPGRWLADVPSGAAVAAPPIPDRGQPGPRVAGARVPAGSVFEVAAGRTEEYYVALPSGLAPVSRIAAVLLIATGRDGGLRQASAATIAAAPAAADRALLGGLPDFLAGTPDAPGGTAVCVRQSAPGHLAGDRVITDAAATGPTAVIVPPDSGMLVAPPVSAGSVAGPAYLIGPAGARYELADSDAASALGYGNAAPVTMPAAVIALVPSGPALSAAAATQPVSGP